ncbi:MAG: xanthine dehydrogenase family protein subunit M [Chloroflexi bacterium]|nr:xanthine dehydrogenase family protein subunit M [Chloroflexota bacterium]
MKPVAFEYYRATSPDEALALLRQHGYEAKLLAGGQSLIPAMNFRLAQPGVLIDLNRVAELAFVEASGGALRIGAMTRQRTAERSEQVAAHAPLLVEALHHTAHPQIRNRGTIGGSIAHADPAAEVPTVMLALGASFELRGAEGSREVAAGDFFTGFFGTALEPEEMVASITIPAAAERTGWAFEEVARRHGDYALAGVAAVLSLDERGQLRDARIALLSVADRPVLAESASALLAGQTPSPALVAEAAELASQGDIDPPSDIHASAEYRRRLVRVLTRRTLSRALERAGAQVRG